MNARLQQLPVLRKASRPVAAALVLLLVGALSADAQTAYTWTGTTSGAWQTTTNWSPSGTPGGSSSDTVEFTSSTGGNNTITTSGSVSIGGISIGPNSSSLTYILDGSSGFVGSNVLTIGSSGISNAGSGTYNTSLDLGNVTLSANQTWVGYASQASDGQNATINLASYTLTINNGLNGSYNVFDGNITGTGSIDLIGSGDLALGYNYYTGLAGSAANTFSGGITLNGSASTARVLVWNSSDLGTGTFTFSNGTFDAQPSGLTFSNALAFGGADGSNSAIFEGNNTTFTGGVNLGVGGPADNLVFNGVTVTFGGSTVLTAGNANKSLTISGGSSAGELILAETVANTFAGNVTIGSGGTLELADTGGVALAGTKNTTITVQSGGTLLLGANNQTVQALNLAGGTFNTQGYSQAMGTLTLSGNSTINLGDSGVLRFAASTSGWTSGDTLDIINWDGSLSGGGTSQIYFGTTTSGLLAGQLAQIYFINPVGLTPGTYGATILSDGEVVPFVPEPSTVLMGAVMVVLMGAWEYRRCRLSKQLEKSPTGK